MAIRKTMYVKENSFRKLDDPLIQIRKSLCFMLRLVMFQKVFRWQRILVIRD